MSFRLIATDLDDTLLDDNSRISERNRQAVRQAVSLGIQFVIATGRMFQTSVKYIDELGLQGDPPLINFHGALIKTAHSQEILFHQPLANSLAVELAEELALHGCYVSLFIGDRIYITEESKYSRFYSSLSGVVLREVGNLAAFLRKTGARPSKISVISWDGRLDMIGTALQERFGEALSVLQSRPSFLEITDRRATKGQALGWLADRLGIAREHVMAFGDGQNDLDMLGYAGLGVAVANARPEVIRVADLVAASNLDDGVAEVIEQYVLNGQGVSLD